MPSPSPLPSPTPVVEHCTVTFDANNGTGKKTTQTVEKGKEVKLKINEFTRPGYKFQGWNTASSGEGVVYEDGKIVTVDKDLTLYAQWRKKDASELISIKNAKVVLKKSKLGYTGKVLIPAVKTINGLELDEDEDYTISVKNDKGKVVKSPKERGKYTLTIEGTGDYKGSTKAEYEIVKGSNTLKVAAKKKTHEVNLSKLKNKKQTISASGIYKFTDINKTKGTIKYTLSSVKKSGKKIKEGFSVSKKSGKVTIDKEVKKGSYKVTVKVSAGNDNYKEVKKNVTFTIKVK